MNPSSIYKKHISHKSSASKSNNSTIQMKDISKITPIPTAIKLKTPERVKTDESCSEFQYPILDIVSTNFKYITKTFSTIAICPYFITTCKNRYGVYKPYIQYLLYKYPEHDKKFKNLLVFPFVKTTSSASVETVANKLLKKIIDIKIKSTGFIQSGRTVYVFYDLSSVDDYSAIPRAEQQWLKLIKKSNDLWWVLMDEICNHRKSLNFSIHHSVTSLFYKNPILIYLRQNSKNVDIPIVAYYGNYYCYLFRIYMQFTY